MAQTIHISGSRGGTVQIGGGQRQTAIEITGSGGTPVPKYTGPYEFTPTAETQVVAIEAKMATENITINPIPQNYGLVTYNGRIITIT